MRRFWWVNHKKTVRHEIANGYLWSPKTEANGARSQFYENMRQAAPGDIITSFAKAEVRFIGVISDYSISAPKPTEFGSKGINWSDEGWLLPVTWQSVSPVRPKSFIDEIASFIPAKYSPIHPGTGNGNQKAYLAEINQQLFDIIAAKSGYNPPESLPASVHQEFSDLLEGAMQAAVENDSSLSATEKEQVIKARRGQGQFRSQLLAIEKRCRITGIENPCLLVASHIKPWRSCGSAGERLDGFNGLLLAPHVDLLFDRGFISFSNDGSVLISSKLTAPDIKQLGLADYLGSKTTNFLPEQEGYLEYHRREILLP